MSVTAPQGFRAAGVSAGLKASGVLDVALVVNDGPARSAAAVFTSNRVKAAPVLWSQEVLRGRPGRRRRAQLRRGQRLHRPGRLPGHPRHRRVGRHGARRLGDRRRGLLDRPDRRPAAHRPAAGRGRRGGAAARRDRGRRRGPRDHDDRLGAEAVGGRGGRLRRRRHGQGRRDARARPGHDARRPHHRRRGRGRPAGRSAAPRHRHDLRPGRLRRVHVDQRHRAAAGLRGVRGRAHR